MRMPAKSIDPNDLAADATGYLERLVSFDTTSRNSNLEIIDFISGELERAGAKTSRVPNGDGNKANLYASLGPDAEGGVVLSGHTDVVPVDGQDWHSDPFTLQRREDRLYGRGTCDMKGFIALALAAARRATDTSRPLHFAFSYDEEVGCLGAPAMIAEIAAKLPTPLAVIVGEPTNMEVVGAHKGISAFAVTVTGHEAHSSLTHLGISANMVAIGLMARLSELAQSLESEQSHDSPFTPPHATLTIGEIQGGTAVNILARQCRFAATEGLGAGTQLVIRHLHGWIVRLPA